MTKINQIQTAILSLDPGAYQKLMDAYILRKYRFANITPLGSHSGTDKTTKGTPDSYVRCEDGRFILIAHGTVGGNAYSKVESDIRNCLDKSKTGIDIEDIYQILCCHTSTNFTPGQAKKLCSHFHNTIIIGLGDVSYDLYLNYPDLARDHLNVNVDTHQIFDINSFIAYVSNNAYSTSLDMALLCREQEMSDVETLLKNNQIVLIMGASGVGKTRLALEVARTFAIRESYNLKIISANGESIYEDVKSAFADDCNYLVLIDDANQLVQLRHILDISADSTRQHQMKIILTVRDYAKVKLIQTIETVCIPSLYHLKILSDDSISQVLSENLNIRKTELIKHIQQIAKGNIRLAIMAGMCAINGRFDSIKNSFDIFNNYYSEMIGNMEREEIMLASLIAFFDSFELQETEMPFGIALQQGINNVRFIEICYTLHKKEVISFFDNKAVKFENQNLRDYLLYYVFFKEKWLSPSYMINCAFPEYKKRVVFAFNTLINLFNTDENIKYIEKEIRTAWAHEKNNSVDTAYEFVEAFHVAIPDESLLFIKQRIDELAEVHENLDGFDFEIAKNNHLIRSELIKMLINFKYTDRFKDAIQLALYYFERNTESPMDIYFLFGEIWGIGNESHKHRYEQELLLLDKLLEYHKQNNSTLSAISVLFAASYSLKLEFSATESETDNKIIYYQFLIPACEEIFSIRSLSFRAYSILLKSPEYRQYAIKGLLDYPSFARLETDPTMLSHDLSALVLWFGTTLNAEDFEICKVLDHFYRICRKSKILYPDQLPCYQGNRIYNLYKSLKKDYHLINENWEEAEAKYRKNIEMICDDTSDEDFSRLWEKLRDQADQGNAHDDWQIGTGIDMIFSILAKNNQSKFILCCESYIKWQTPYGGNSSGIIEGLIRNLGYDDAIKYLRLHEFEYKTRWLVSIYNCITIESVDKNACDEILNCLTSSLDGEGFTVSLLTVLRVDSIYQGFLVKYISALSAESARKPYLMSGFMEQIGWRENPNADEFIVYFSENIDVLCTAYIHAFHGRDYFDHKGSLLTQIIQRNKPFLSIFIKEMGRGASSREDVSRLDTLWEQDDHLELISIVMETLKGTRIYSFDWNTLGEGLLNHNQSNPKICSRQDKWIEYYIVNHYSDRGAMDFLFGIVCNCSEEQRLHAIMLFCKNNSSFEDFSNIQITPTHMSWSGSEVPIIEKRISFLERIRDSLNGFEFLEHRERISMHIQNHRERKERILLKEFLEER